MALNLNLSRIFGNKTLQRGRNYFQAGHVMAIDLDEAEAAIIGKVRGSGRKAYDASIRFDPFDTKGYVVEGFCSCPVEFNCKHVCALLLEAERQFGANEVNALLGEPEAQKKAGQRQTWLKRLKKSVTVNPPLQTAKQNTTTTVYIPHFHQNGSVSMTLHSCRPLKNGGLGKPSRELNLDVYYGYYYNTPKWPKSLNEDDQQIVKIANMEDQLTSYHRAILLQGKTGTILLEKIIATGRCWLDAESKTVVQPGEPLQPEVRWLLDEDGHQSPALYSAKEDASNDHRLNLITTEPPYYLKVSQQRTS
ncbi:MAG: SWIM zinc finger family protein, partial [Endozoicomonas sp.]